MTYDYKLVCQNDSRKLKTSNKALTKAKNHPKEKKNVLVIERKNKKRKKLT